MYKKQKKYSHLFSAIAGSCAFGMLAAPGAVAELETFSCIASAGQPSFGCHGFLESTLECQPITPNPIVSDDGVRLASKGVLQVLNALRSDQLAGTKVTYTNGPWDLTSGMVVFPTNDVIDPGLYPPILPGIDNTPDMRLMEIQDVNQDYEQTYKMTVAALNRVSGVSCDGASSANVGLYSHVSMANNALTSLFYPATATPPTGTDIHGQAMSIKWNYSSYKSWYPEDVATWLQSTLNGLGTRSLFAKVAMNRPGSGSSSDDPSYYVVIYWPDYDATQDAAYADWFAEHQLLGWSVSFSTGDDPSGDLPFELLREQVQAAGQGFQDSVSGFSVGEAMFAKTIFNRGDGNMDYHCTYGNQIFQIIPQFAHPAIFDTDTGGEETGRELHDPVLETEPEIDCHQDPWGCLSLEDPTLEELDAPETGRDL